MSGKRKPGEGRDRVFPKFRTLTGNRAVCCLREKSVGRRQRRKKGRKPGKIPKAEGNMDH